MTIILLSLVDSVSQGFGRGAPWAVQGLSVVVRWRLELGRLGVGGASFSVDRELLRVVSLAGLLGLPHSMAAQGARVSVLRHGRFSRAAAVVARCHFHHIPLVTGQPQAYPGSWGKELDFSS